MGAIHSTKIYGNFDLRTGWIGLVQPERFRKNYEKMGWTGAIEMDCSIWPFRHILNPSASLFDIFHVQHERKHSSFQFLWIINRGSIGVTGTFMCSYSKYDIIDLWHSILLWLIFTITEALLFRFPTAKELPFSCFPFVFLISLGFWYVGFGTNGVGSLVFFMQFQGPQLPERYYLECQLRSSAECLN